MSAKDTLWERSRNLLLGHLGGRERWALSDQAICSGTNFLTNVMLARFLGLREFGVFALAWMSVLFVNSLQSALIVGPMTSVGPKQEEKDRPSYFGAVLFQELVLVSLCFVLVFATLKLFGNFFRHEDLHRLAMPLAVSAFAYQLQDFFRRYFFITRQSRRALADDALSYLTQLPVLFFLHRAGHLNSATALWAMAGTSILGLVVGWFWFEPIEFHSMWIKAIWWRHWKIARWLTPSALMQWTSGNLFTIAAPVYYGPAAAGAMRASVNLLGVTHLWVQGLENVVPAEASRRLRAGGVHSMLAYTRSILVTWGGLTLLFAIVLGAVPSFWLRLMYGPEMVPYGYVLRLYALFYVIFFLAVPIRAGLMALEFTSPIFWSFLAMTAFSMTFAFPMARWLGLSGSMLGIIGTQILSQSIIGTALFLRARRVARDETLEPGFPS